MGVGSVGGSNLQNMGGHKLWVKTLLFAFEGLANFLAKKRAPHLAHPTLPQGQPNILCTLISSLFPSSDLCGNRGIARCCKQKLWHGAIAKQGPDA